MALPKTESGFDAADRLEAASLALKLDLGELLDDTQEAPVPPTNPTIATP